MALYGLYPRMGIYGGLYGSSRFLRHATYAPVYTKSGNAPYNTYTMGAGINYYGTRETCFKTPENNAVQDKNAESIPSVKEAEINLPSNAQKSNEPQPSKTPADKYTPQTKEAKLLNMQYILESAKNEQGIFGKAIDKVKSITKLGLSSKTCQAYVDAAKNGIMDVNLAYDLVSEYSAKQKNAINTITGISAAVLGGALFKGKAEPKALLAALSAGASLKAGVKAVDRMTNGIKGDAFNLSNVAKDTLQGTLNSAVGIGASKILSSGAASYDKISSAILKETAKSGGAGAIGGAAVGASDYALESAFDKDNKFNKKHFLEAVAYSAVAGGLAGAVRGGVVSGKKLSPKANVQGTADESAEISKRTIKGAKTVNSSKKFVKKNALSSEKIPTAEILDDEVSETTKRTIKGAKTLDPSKIYSKKNPELSPHTGSLEAEGGKSAHCSPEFFEWLEEQAAKD